jgi:hypothetical protein
MKFLCCGPEIIQQKRIKQKSLFKDAVIFQQNVEAVLVKV